MIVYKMKQLLARFPKLYNFAKKIYKRFRNEGMINTVVVRKEEQGLLPGSSKYYDSLFK